MTSFRDGNNAIITIALDGMGGDFAPTETVAGAVEAARGGGVAIVITGELSVLEKELEKHEAVDKLPIKLVAASGIVEEGESPASAFRSKPKASIFVATHLVSEGQAQAVVSMGSSGATIAAATVMLGTYDGVERPCLGGPIIGLSPNTVIMDVGTNVDCRPRQLVDFAALGAVMSKVVYGVENPRVALLSVGTEEGKGNRLVKETSVLLRSSPLKFIGNVEANQLPFGPAEVVVVDGFTGNMVMKLTEGLGDALSSRLRIQLSGKMDADEVNAFASEIYELTNPVEFLGGGPLVGVKGVAIIGHGKARAFAVSNALGLAQRLVKSDFVGQGGTALDEMRQAVGTSVCDDKP